MRWRFLFPALATLLIGGGAPAASPNAVPPPPAPQRILSLNLCADQYVALLADPGQIAALTPLSRDPHMSAVAVRARGLPVAPGRAENILALRPDLILASPFRPAEIAALLERRRYRTLDLPPAESYAAIVAQVRQVAGAVGHPERGERLVARMDRDLAAIRRAGQGRVAAYYQRRGYLTGTGTLIDELMRRVGLVNLAGREGRPVLSRLSLEQLLVARPDFLIIESATDEITDQGTEMLHHPALSAIPRLRLPQAWTVCGGPAFVQAAQSLVRQLEAAPPSQGGGGGGAREWRRFDRGSPLE